MIHRWIRGLLILSALIICVMILIGLKLSVKGHQGPTTAHFNGQRFYNRPHTPQHSFSTILKWQLTRSISPWVLPTHSKADHRPVRVTQAVCITALSHASFLIQTPQATLITDPIWSMRASPLTWAGPKRVTPPPIPFETLPPIDYVLISHNHYDSLDLKTLQRLKHAHHPVFVAGLGNEHLLTQKHITPVVTLDWWDHVPHSKLPIQFMPAQHFSGRGLFDRNNTLWGGFLIQSPIGSIYFAGDTGLGPFIDQIKSRIGAIKIALLPIGAYEPRYIMKPMHMNPEESVKTFKKLNPTFAMGMHFDTFEGLADEAQYQAIKDLQTALKKYQINPHLFIAPQPGQRRCWPIHTL
ncbi:MAG: hypothetical protein CMF51_03660 [Legionellales bacterium]|nr:hypothetical protein [Legionellales bacterium]